MTEAEAVPEPKTPLDDDHAEPVADSGEDPALVSPLKPFASEKPPAPPWFDAAIADAPERRFIESRGGRIELLTWGEVGKPGLLFIHGSSAHADWWSFIAPFFARDYRVAALSLAGMGLSDWRETYSYPDNIIDTEAAARAAGLHEGGRKPIYIGHSFGGAITYYAACNNPAQMHAAILLDTGLRSPGAAGGRRPLRERLAGSSRDRVARVYPDLTAALARFRVTPPQPIEHLYIADHIARLSLKPAPMPDGSGQGFTWRFDPNIWTRFVSPGFSGGMLEDVSRLKVPVIHILGDRSLVTADREHSMIRDLPTIVMPEAYHHLMIDSPLGLVSALRTALALWPS